MKKKNKQNQIYDRELKVADKFKEIGEDKSLSRDELLKEFLELGKE